MYVSGNSLYGSSKGNILTYSSIEFTITLVNVYNSNQAVTYNFHHKILLIKLQSSENSDKPI